VRVGSEAEADVVVQLIKLTTANHGSVLLESDLVREVLVHDELLNAFSASSLPATYKQHEDEHKHTPASLFPPPMSNTLAFPPLMFNTLFPPPMPPSAFGQTSAGDAEVKTFTVSTKEEKNDEGEIESHLMVTIEDQTLRQVVNVFVNDEERPRVEAETLFCHMTQFKSATNAQYRSVLKPLVDWLDKQFEVRSAH
jgi:hypothetical protein